MKAEINGLQIVGPVGPVGHIFILYLISLVRLERSFEGPQSPHVLACSQTLTLVNKI